MEDDQGEEQEDRGAELDLENCHRGVHLRMDSVDEAAAFGKDRANRGYESDGQSGMSLWHSILIVSLISTCPGHSRTAIRAIRLRSTADT